MAGEKGSYFLDIMDTCMIYGDKNAKLTYAGKKIQCLQSEHVIVFKIDREVFTIPKRILSEGKEAKLRRMIGGEDAQVINIVIERK